MRLDELTNLHLQQDDVVEFCLWHDDNPIRLGYFIRIVEQLPSEYQEGHKTPPYVEIGNKMEKHGCVTDSQEYALEELKWFHRHSMSASKTLHWFS
jgi:hypothetical protein